MFIPGVLITMIVGFLFWKSKMNVGKYGSLLLILTYVAYLGYVVYLFRNDED